MLLNPQQSYRCRERREHSLSVRRQQRGKDRNPCRPGINPAAPFYFGSSPSYNARNFILDNFRLFNRALTNYEIKDFYEKEFNYFNSLKRKPYLLDFMNNLSKKRENPCRIYNFLSDDVMRDMDLIDVLLKFDPNNIKYVPKDLREDHSFIKNVIEKYKVNELEPIFNNNKELITKIIEKNGKYLKKFSQYINDIDMVKLALKTYNHIDILTPNMLENKELVLDILKKDPSECKHLFSLKKYVNDLDVMKLAIKHDHKLFYHSNSITDIEILNYVVEKTEDFALVIKEQIQNKELMIKLINNKENINKICKTSLHITTIIVVIVISCKCIRYI